MFATGASGLVFEYILSTVSTYILGNSIEQFSITIALMLFMMGVAGYVQKFFSDKKLIEKFILIEVLIAILGGIAPIAMYAAFGLMEDHFVLVQYFFVCSIGFLIGFEIPLVLRINETFSKTLGINIANIYGPDYLGSFVGAMVWTYYLLKNFPLTEISFILAGINFIIAVITFLYFLKFGLVSKKVRSALLIALTFIVLIAGYTSNRGWSHTLEQKLYDDKIVFAKTTKYQRLVMTHSKSLDEYRFYINGNLQFSSVDEAIYHEQLVHPVMSLTPDHAKVLILGGGDGMALREVLKYDDVREVLLVDLDPAMTTFCANNETLRKLNSDAFRDSRVSILSSGAVASDGVETLYQETGRVDNNNDDIVKEIAKVNVLNIDADKFLSEIKEKWNVIIVDMPDPNSIELTKLYSREFYMKLKRALSEHGMVVVQSTSPYHAKEAFLCVLRTIRSAGFSAIPYHDNVPSFGDWGWIIASKSSVASTESINKRIDDLDSFSVETRYLTLEVFKKARVFGKGLLDSKESDINTLMEPVLLEKYLHYSWLNE